ncbi:hypothetical protein [Haloarchaeobius sp. HRN-SO-5]|uniref:hypothetical protein n=1 Tax=Haloarchaeobius sp. HRN-SO-5 TaxID=3446118 RepID=UPI003EB8E3D1
MMDFTGWLGDSYRNVRSDGWKGLRQSIWPAYRKIIEQGRRFQPAGDNIYDYEWDLLIVVDACRLDLMQEVEPEYSYISDVSSHWSLDSTTALWMERTFKSRDTSETTYICSNPFSDERLDAASFSEFQEVWKDIWVDPGTVPPRPVTDATIDSMRNNRSSRTITHYLQPHCPFIPRPELSAGKKRESFSDQDHRDVWELYRDGDIEVDDLWDGYRSNLELVLDEIELLLNNVTAEKIVITSDHGNALGKLGIYGHPPRMPHHSLREVPWIETTAEDSGEHTPETEFEDPVNMDREEQLRALGYF